MWESRRNFQRVWEGWEAGFMAFHVSTLCHFHGLLWACLCLHVAALLSHLSGMLSRAQSDDKRVSRYQDGKHCILVVSRRRSQL